MLTVAKGGHVIFLPFHNFLATEFEPDWLATKICHAQNLARKVIKT